MSTSLQVLKERNERPRFARQHVDDSRTAIGRGDASALANELRRTIQGEVRFDRGSRALYATDASNYRQVPIGVVVPKTKDDVEAVITAARTFGAPILSRGGGTSLAGQSCNVAVIMDFSKYMHHVIGINADRRLGRVLPGCVLDDFRSAAKQHGLMFGPDPATHSRCTLGGMLGNNSCGIHSLLSSKHGFGLRTSDNTHELEVLTYNGIRMRVGPTPDDELQRIIQAGGHRGEIYSKLKSLRDRHADLIRNRMPVLPRRVSGYNLNELLPENGFHVARALVGTESTCVTILEAVLHLVPNPKARSLLILGYPDIVDAARHVMEILPFQPTGLEGIDHLLFKWVRNKGDKKADIALLPDGNAWLLVEFGGESKQDSDDQARRLMDHLKKQRGNPPSMKLFDDPHHEQQIWEVREGSLGSTAWVPGHPDTWPGFEDSAVPPENVADYLADLRALMNRHDYHPSLYGHLGQGCIHCRIGFDVYTAGGIDRFKRFLDEATDLVARYGGSMSGEHGDGQARAQFVHKMFGPELMAVMREFKAIWDPDGKMNPGKVVDAYAVDTNLRIGPDYNPPQPKTHFKYPADRSSWSRAILRCVGVGACRNEGGQTMCPSYMVTREEKHSTRGRSRLLWEMMNGDVLTDGWKNEEVKEALDLCLACKGCKNDCPVNVDMATYKAEFLSHYYEGRLRPRHAYAFGWAPIVSYLASFAPMVANFFTQASGLRAIVKFMAGMEQKRRIPMFAPESFQRWFQRREPRNPAGRPVLLFADTFNNFYHTDTAKAAVEVLEDAGFRVRVPTQHLCCGRPLYDYGFLDMAERWLRDILQTLRPEIEAGVPVVVLEPSCWAVFHDELTNLLPNDSDAHRLRDNCYMLGDFLQECAPEYRPPKLNRKALLHGHCHHKALRGRELAGERAVLEQMDLKIHEPEDGCCGMAGAFGFEAGEHYDVSIKCGERMLLPKVRQAKPNEVIIADGFSCREQISQTTDREALHLAQVIRLAKHSGPNGPDDGTPEAELLRTRTSEHRQAAFRTAAYVGAGAVAGVLLYGLLRRRGTSQERSLA
jgi:FAD/FMN-containing dehydrogenase/Fe-S oxidoreductase